MPPLENIIFKPLCWNHDFSVDTLCVVQFMHMVLISSKAIGSSEEHFYLKQTDKKSVTAFSRNKQCHTEGCQVKARSSAYKNTGK